MVLQWRVLKKAKVKAGVELDSEKVASLGVGAVVTALEQQGNRVRCSEGWVSILSESGAVLLEAVLPDLSEAFSTPASSAPSAPTFGHPDPRVLAKDKGSWSELTSAEQGAASVLGWDGEMWDRGDSPAAVHCGWAALGSERQEPAALLGYNEVEWDVEHSAHSPAKFVDAEQDRSA